MHQAIQRVLLLRADGDAMECHSQIVAHGLHLAVLRALEPGQRGVSREEIDPAFERFRYVDTEFEGALHDGRAWIRCEDVGPEFRAWIPPTDIEDQLD